MTFVPIKGFEGYYSINSDGVVLNHKVNKEGVPIKVIGKPHHAKRVVLRIPYHDSVNVRLDKLVAEHFLKKTNELRYLHNLSGDLNDYSVSNLEYKDYVQSVAAIEPALLKELSLQYINGFKTTKQLAEMANTVADNVSSKVKAWCIENGLEDKYIKRAMSNRDNAVKMTGTNAGKAVVKFSKDGEYITEYRTVTIAAKANNIAVPTLSAALDLKHRTAGGFRWRSLSKMLPLVLKR